MAVGALATIGFPFRCSTLKGSVVGRFGSPRTVTSAAPRSPRTAAGRTACGSPRCTTCCSGDLARRRWTPRAQRQLQPVQRRRPRHHGRRSTSAGMVTGPRCRVKSANPTSRAGHRASPPLRAPSRALRLPSHALVAAGPAPTSARPSRLTSSSPPPVTPPCRRLAEDNGLHAVLCAQILLPQFCSADASHLKSTSMANCRPSKSHSVL